MRVMVCIPLDINVDTTRRKDIREAVRARLDAGIHHEYKQCLDADTFVVRAPESTQAKAG